MIGLPNNGHQRRRGRGLFLHDGGAAALEFALVLPILLVVLMGIIEFGRAWNRQQIITDAAREGARRAVVRDNAANKTADVIGVLQVRLNAAGMAWNGSVSPAASCDDPWQSSPDLNAVVVSGCGWGGATGTEARVAISVPYPFDMLRPIMGLLPGGGTIGQKVLSTNFVMRNE